MAPGTRLGPYEIAAAIGAGGMGEVYRARDPKLKRDVAIKVLPDAFARDPERMARFQREAEVLASLNHSNIAQIYGVEDRALVMELVDGESPKGPLPFEEAWKIAAQVADALEYAHERGIVHRDLKPANVKVTPEGAVKLLDFGLAKALSAPGTTAAGDQENSPTLTMGSTQIGVILGTAAYMAPEQAKGKSVDKRADIWAFGVVLYELLTGERLFQGDDVSEILAQVLTKQADLDRVPFAARRLLAECLAKDPKNRLRDIGDAKRLLGDGAKDGSPQSEPRPARRSWIPWAVTAVLFLGLAVSLAWIFKPAPPLPITRFPIALGEGQVLANTSRLDLAVSPDGTQIAYVANRGL
ncbi:MAG TPA: serine/threonine-protein kinase, partial [Bryobacteraceae bacterium]|nr:serine/threonine-protein kinase [Bryobacteraceae bacterium]